LLATYKLEEISIKKGLTSFGLKTKLHINAQHQLLILANPIFIENQTNWSKFHNAMVIPH
jgi:hypothetical protein